MSSERPDIIDLSDEETQKMELRARRAWRALVALVHNNTSALQNIYIKASTACEEAQCIEHMWYRPSSIEDYAFEGVLINTPANVPGVKGNSYRIPLYRLTDFFLVVAEDKVLDTDYFMQLLEDQ